MKIKYLLKKAFTFSPEFELVKVSKFQKFDQYEVVAADLSANKMHFKTFYFWQGNYYNLLSRM